MELALFAMLAIVAAVSAFAMIQSKNSIHSALFLILNFGCVALLFLMLDAPFISMVQIAVYAGAIMVLFLFVIMLLGAEQTTDTEARRLNWLPRTTAILAVLLIAALGVGFVFVSQGLNLPEAEGEAPRLRIIHAANAEDPVSVALDGIEVFSELYFGDVTEFAQVEMAGDYAVTVTDATGAVILETSLSLANNQVASVVAHGDETLATSLINHNLSTTGEDEARLYFLNLYTEDKLVLVDLGADRSLTTDSTGQEITDRVRLEAVPYAELLPAQSFDAGEYTYGFYRQRLDGTWQEVAALRNPEIGFWNIEESREQIIILSPNYNGVADANNGYSAIVFDSLQEDLVLETNEAFGAPRSIGRSLFVEYLLPVNLVGFLLLVALVGVIVLTRPEMLTSTRRSSINRRRKVSRPLVSVISQQTGEDVLVDVPKLEDPSAGD